MQSGLPHRVKKIVEKAIREQTAAEQLPGKSDLDIFISHSSKDSDAAGLLVELLKAAFNLPSKKIRCSSLVNYGLPAGSSIDEQLKNEVHGCRMLIGLLSVNSLQSAYVLFELGARWGASKPLIPLLIDRESGKLLDGPLKGIHALACWEEAQLYQLLNQVGEQLGLESEAPPVFQKQIRQLSGYHTGE